MDEVRKSLADRQVNNALNIRNGPSTTMIHDLPLNSPVLVFQERNTGQSGSWKRPYKLLALENESAILELLSGPTKFRSTSVKPYHDPATVRIEDDLKENTEIVLSLQDILERHDTSDHDALSTEIVAPLTPVKRSCGRPRKTLTQTNFTSSPDICFMLDYSDSFTVSDVNQKHLQFTASRQKEIFGLLENGVFKVVSPEDVPKDARNFNSQFVNEIKNAGTDKAFEKSRLIVQAYNNVNKGIVLTQSPTI